MLPQDILLVKCQVSEACLVGWFRDGILQCQRCEDGLPTSPSAHALLLMPERALAGPARPEESGERLLLLCLEGTGREKWHCGNFQDGNNTGFQRVPSLTLFILRISYTLEPTDVWLPTGCNQKRNADTAMSRNKSTGSHLSAPWFLVLPSSHF